MIDRRWLFTLAGGLALVAATSRAQGASTPVVRVSRGGFAADQLAMVERVLDFSGQPVEAAIKRLPGLLHYWSGIDREARSVANVSVWRTLADARRMDTLREMRDLRGAFTKAGIRFDPITNYTTLWQA